MATEMATVSIIEETTTLAELRALPIGDVVTALAPEMTPASTHREGPFGNVFFREMKFEKIGSIHAGHCHHYDHVTFISSGAVNVDASEVDMETQKKKTGRTINRQFQAPAMILIKKNWAHTITALADNTVAHCIYAIRDFDGDVSQEWNGDMEPYT